MSGTLTDAAGPIAGTPPSTLYDYTTGFVLQDDFMGGGVGSNSIGTLGWSTGGGTVTAPVSETNHPGLIRRDTSASSGTFTYLYLPSVQGALLAGSVEMTYVYRLNTNDANTTARIGAMYLINTTPTDGEYFEKKDADTNWFCVTRAASVETASRIDSGIAVGTGWVTFKLVRTANTSVAFFINGVLVSTNTANLPTAQGLTVGTQLVNSAAAAKTHDHDYFQLIRHGDHAMKTGLLFLLLLLPAISFALGDQEVLYVRPSGACTFNGNGAAYACAASTNAAGAKKGMNNVLWSATDGTAGSVDPNDILYVCGEYIVTAVDVTQRIRPTVNGNGTDGHIIIDGRCPNDPGSVTGQDVGARLEWLDDRFYIQLQYLDIHHAGSADYAISIYNQGQQDNDRHIIIDHHSIHDNLNVTTSVWAWGAHITYTYNVAFNNSTDYFYVKGGRNFTATHNSCTQMAGPADCIQQDATALGATGTITINDNYCDKAGASDLKYCYLIGPGNGRIEVMRNTALCPVASTSQFGCSPILVDTKVTGGDVTTAEVVIARNTTRRGWRGITLFRGIPGTRALIVGNDVADAGTIGIWLHSTVDNVLVANNTLVGNGILSATPASGAHAVYVTKLNSTAISIQNNILAGNYRGLYMPGTYGGTNLNNDYFNQTSWNIDTGSQGTIEASGLTADPKFLNAAASDYRLDGPSPLRQAGATVAECVDRNGVPCTATPDLGAYQSRHGTPPGGVLTPEAGAR